MFKKVLTWLAIGFVLFYVVTEPESAAGAVLGVIGAIVAVFEAIITFVTTLFSGIAEAIS